MNLTSLAQRSRNTASPATTPEVTPETSAADQIERLVSTVERAHLPHCFADFLPYRLAGRFQYFGMFPQHGRFQLGRLGMTLPGLRVSQGLSLLHHFAIDRLAGPLPSPADTGGTDGDPAKFRHDEISGGNQGGTDKQGTEPKTKPKATPGTDGDDTGAGGTEPGDLGELTSWPRGKAVSDPDAMKKPLLLVEYEGRAAAVLLTGRTCSPL